MQAGNFEADAKLSAARASSADNMASPGAGTNVLAGAPTVADKWPGCQKKLGW